MAITLAFDIYGTLIDTHGVVERLQDVVGEKAVEFSNAWRNKQLEYSFRRGLMQNYENFAVCTRDALEFTCSFYKIPLSESQKRELLESYKTLPVFDDVKSALTILSKEKYQLYAFSNGSADAVYSLLTNAGIKKYFIGVTSTDEIQSFKPNPAVYHHFLKKSGATGAKAWLISSNPFDVIGAVSAGMKAAWVQRSKESIFDPWGIEPTITVKSLLEISEQILNSYHAAIQ